MFTFKGSYVALVTPFNPDGSVNFKKLEELCEFQIQNGTDGIVVLGTTGESSTMESGVTMQSYARIFTPFSWANRNASPKAL